MCERGREREREKAKGGSTHSHAAEASWPLFFNKGTLRSAFSLLRKRERLLEKVSLRPAPPRRGKTFVKLLTYRGRVKSQAPAKNLSVCVCVRVRVCACACVCVCVCVCVCARPVSSALSFPRPPPPLKTAAASGPADRRTYCQTLYRILQAFKHTVGLRGRRR